MRYYLIAGERSGDLHGSNLIRSLKHRDDEAVFRCWGGELMKEAGADLAMHYNNFSFMGFIEVIFYFRKILSYLKRCRKDIQNFDPDVVILIDFAGFNMKMARYLKKKNIRVFYYISPKIWAWYRGRARQIKRDVERMFVIMPFEKKFYQHYGFEVDYVGNPVVDAVKHHQPDKSFLTQAGMDVNERYIALLPGSRKQELISVQQSLITLAQSFPKIQFVLCGLKSLDSELYDQVKAVSNIYVVFDRTYDVLAFSRAAIVTSGTATLETALWDIPQVVIYRTNSPVSMFIARRVIKVKFISLVNLIAGREVVRELIQENLTPEHLHTEVERLYSNEDYRKRILTDYTGIRNILGNETASDKAAALMFGYLSG